MTKKKKFRLGKIKTKVCNRCKELFFPSHGGQILCPYCQARPYAENRKIPAQPKCLILGCDNQHYAKGYCAKHYRHLNDVPNDTKKKRLIAAQIWLKEGMVMCEMFKNCEIYFIPKARNQYGVQKICPHCAAQRSYKITREKTGRPRKK